jgi:hypothetical protein
MKEMLVMAAVVQRGLARCSFRIVLAPLPRGAFLSGRNQSSRPELLWVRKPLPQMFLYPTDLSPAPSHQPSGGAFFAS